MNRSRLVEEFHKQSAEVWDVIIIGGGATGLGIALDSVTRGYKTLLLEQSDFSAGTSSRSTKLVHGGVRYLAKGDIFLVIEALKERGYMLKNAPHLTLNQEFIIPVYSIWDSILYTVGLKFYDLLSGKLSLGKSYFLGKDNTMKRLPYLVSRNLRGGVVYHDGQFDDSRMAVSIVGNCIKRGATLLNYFRVTGLLKNENGKIDGVVSSDLISGETYNLKSKLVINAAGVFADLIHRMDDSRSEPTIRPSQGVHIVVDKNYLASETAIMIPKTDDGRVLFAIPWYDKVVIGTTDTPLEEITMEPVALNEEINFILKTAGKYLTKAPERKDVLSIFAGLRPLAASSSTTSTKEVSRRHKITISSSNLLTIIGGKWTTYRRMAEEVIDKAINEGFLEKKRCITKNLVLGENGHKDARLRIYGEGADEIAKMEHDDPETGRQVNSLLPYTYAEIIWICRNEMPVTITDVLARRTRALLLNAKASSMMAPVVAEIMAKEFLHDENWKKEQINEYNHLINSYL